MFILLDWFLWTFLRWRLRIPLWENILGQWGHVYGLSPVCFLRWTAMLQLLANVRSHPSTKHLKVLLYLFVFGFMTLMVWHIDFEMALKPFFFPESKLSSSVSSSWTSSICWSSKEAGCWLISCTVLFRGVRIGAVAIVIYSSEIFRRHMELSGFAIFCTTGTIFVIEAAISFSV